MIAKISVTVTAQGLQLFCVNDQHEKQRCSWPIEVEGDKKGLPPIERFSDWFCGCELQASLRALLVAGMCLAHGLQKGDHDAMRSVTFDVGSGWIDCHLASTNSEEAVLRYQMQGKTMPKQPLILAGSLDHVALTYLEVFNYTLRDRLSSLAYAIACANEENKTGSHTLELVRASALKTA